MIAIIQQGAGLDICNIQNNRKERIEIPKMKKSIISILLVVALVVCALPASAFADWEPGYPSISKRNDDGNWVIRINGTPYNIDYGTVIRKGNTSYVREVDVCQMALNRINARFSSANCNVGGSDGIFGNGTFTGVKNFQTYWNNYKASQYHYHIDVDGIVGNCSWACISGCSN